MNATKRRGRPPKYKWADYFTSRKFRFFVQGVDFHCEPTSFGIQLRENAMKRGFVVRVSISDKTVYMERID